jgi:nitric oxide dioxygenase
MVNDWKNLKDAIEYPKEGILSKELFKDDKTDVALFCLAGGSQISEHTSTRQGFVYVVEGSGLFNLEGKDILMAPGVIIYMKKDAIHHLKAENNLSFILLLIND